MRVLWPIYKLQAEHTQYPGVQSISALLKAHGISTEVVPGRCDAVCDKLREDPDAILAFSVTTVLSSFYMDLNRQIKRYFPDVMSVFGGPHPTFFPEIVDDRDVDAVCVGEGEYPMLELVTAVSGGEPIHGIPNWWVKDDGAVHRNPVRPLLEDLDALPIPDHDLFLRATSGRLAHALVLTSRGCPHCCTYCYNHVYRKLYAGKGRAVRRRSVDHVMRELEVVKAAGCRFIRFMDDLFILSPEWVREFSKRYRREIGIPFSCLVRANLVTEDVARDLASAGCYRVLMGVEAGNDRVRNEILKRRMSKEQILEAARLVRGAGMKLVTANILAIPGAGFAEDWETLELNRACRPSYASVSLMQAYPGTEIYDYAAGLDLVQEHHAARVSSSLGFGTEIHLKLVDESERSKVENLHRLFSFVVWFPWLTGLVRRLVRLPRNRFFDRVYWLCQVVGSHLVSVPPRIGLPILLDKAWHRLSGMLRRKSPGDPSLSTGP